MKNYKKYLDLKDVEKLYNAELKILAVSPPCLQAWGVLAIHIVTVVPRGSLLLISSDCLSPSRKDSLHLIFMLGNFLIQNAFINIPFNRHALHLKIHPQHFA